MPSALLESLIDTYNEQQSEVEVRPLYIAYDSYVNKLESAIPRDNGPDVFIYAHEKIGAWKAANLIAPISEAPANELHPITTQAMSTEGSLYGIPLAFKCLALFRNTDLLATRPETTDDILALQGQYDDGVFPLAYQATTAFFHAPWLHGFGGGLFNEDDQPTLNSQGNKDSSGLPTQLGDAKLIPEEPTSPLIAQLFNQQQAALVISGPWFLGHQTTSIMWLSPCPPLAKPVSPPHLFSQWKAPFSPLEASTPNRPWPWLSFWHQMSRHC